jgi:hypothetical protein
MDEPTQFIQPKEVKRQHHPPRTTNQASKPPSGKSAGLIPPVTGFGTTPACSRSASASTLDSGKIFAPVSLFCWPNDPLMVRSSEDRTASGGPSSNEGFSSFSTSLVMAILKLVAFEEIRSDVAGL